MKLQGIYTALLTPFDQHNQINKKELQKLVRYNRDLGVQGFYVGGSTGEAFLLNTAERKQIMEIVAETVRKEAPELKLIAHIGSINEAEALELALHAKALSYDAISSVAPFYYKFTFDEIRNYYFRLADQSGMPMIVYHFPAFSGVNMGVKEISTFFEKENIIGIKFTSNDFFTMEQIKTAFPDKLVFNGFDEMFLAGLSMGADGAIGSTYNFMADKFVEIKRLFDCGEIAAAQAIQKEANRMIKVLCDIGVMQAEKEVLNQAGFHFGTCRPPFSAPTAIQKEVLAKEVLPYITKPTPAAKELHKLIEKNQLPGSIYANHRIPGLVQTSKGTLLAYYECRKTINDWAQIDLKVIRSTDDGDTFEPVFLIPGEGNTLNNPVMIVKDHVIHMLFCKNYRQLFYSKSTDDGCTFSTPVEISIAVNRPYTVLAVGPGHGIVHHGNLLVPIWFAYDPEDAHAHRPSFISTLYSADDGQTWQVGEYIGLDILRNPSECALAITPDNRVMVSIRNENEYKQRAFAFSDTGYSAWQNLHFDPHMPDPCCMGSMCHDSDRMYHMNCATSYGRTSLSVKISTDQFETFDTLLIHEIGGYSDIAVRDGKLYVFYESDARNGGLYFDRIDMSNI